MKVYRVEDKGTGLGPYQMQLTEDHHYWEEKCPSPTDDGVFPWEEYLDYLKGNREELKEYSYGCPSVDDLKAWFTEGSLRKFDRKKSFVYEYEVPTGKVKLGEKQCAFKKKDIYSRKRVPYRKLFH